MQPSPHALKCLKNTLETVWQNGQRPIGLAVSGGVDSMALASLASQLSAGSRSDSAKQETPFHGFIVDHQIRSGSTEEAHKVAAELQRLRIKSHVLHLNSAVIRQHATSTNLESVLRRLRYRALGTACRDHGIRTLLVAHHADDQAETILTRIVTGYTGFGLAGVRARAPIPECSDIYGVSQPDDPKNDRNLPSKSGGIEILRPLINVRKSDLIDICNASGVKWFEDHTNADHRLTLRNTVRRLLKTNVLPKALQSQSLQQIAEQASNRRANLQQEASKLIADLPIQLDIWRGSASFDATALQHGVLRLGSEYCDVAAKGMPTSGIEQKLYSVAALVARDILALVSPQSNISLQDLDLAVDLITEPTFQSNRVFTKTMQVAGVSVQRRCDQPHVNIHRAIPTSRELVEKKIVLYPFPYGENVEERVWSPWQLWDNRYWIRIAPPLASVGSDPNVLVRFFREHDLLKLLHHPNGLMQQAAKLISERVPGKLSNILPVIAMTEQIAVLPTLGWSVPAWSRIGNSPNPDDHQWLWDIRCKHF